MIRANDIGVEIHSAVLVDPDDKNKFVCPGYVLAFDQDDEESRVVRFRASTPALDRHGTIVRTEGIDTTNFKNNPIFLWAHDGYDWPELENVIGTVENWEQDEKRFDIDAAFAPPSVNPKGEMALRMVRGKFLRAVSIGFYAKDAGYEIVEDHEVYVYRKSELLEVSLVPIPANPEALVIANAFGFSLKKTPPSKVDFGEAIRRYTGMRKVAREIRAWRG